MNTEKRRQAARWLNGTGIEVGALHNPLAVPATARVQYVDRMSNEDLRRHYPEHDGATLAPVSIIGDAHDLSAIADASIDFVIANHLVEHLDNPIRGLVEMVRVLRPGGILYVALPEPRVSFDRFRQLTSVEHIVNEYRHGPDSTREEHFRDWVHNVEAHVEGIPKRADKAKADRVRELMDMDYSIHFHLWRPDTFLEFLVAACREGNLLLEPLEFIPCMGGDDNEFIFILAKGIAEKPPWVPPPPGEDGAQEVFELRSRLQRTEAALDAMAQSRSWRMTAPFRAALRRARGTTRAR
ncbi:MAG: methyltransferase domain-containing protein [Candidatus Dormibacteria bacterium]